jgi:ribosome-associated protein
VTPVRVGRSLVIPDDEIAFKFSASGGPGGQHANRSATRAELTWNVAESRALGPVQRRRLLSNLANRLDSSGNLRLASHKHRSQTMNRAEVTARLARLVGQALRPAAPRVATQPTPAARTRRLDAKRRRGALKRTRGAVPEE